MTIQILCIYVACLLIQELLSDCMIIFQSSVLKLGAAPSIGVVKLLSRTNILITQAVSRRLLTAEADVRALVDSCGIYGGQSGNGTCFSPSCLILPCQYHSAVSLNTYTMSFGG
jgi:hypothetical protein